MSIRDWGLRFERMFANTLKRRRPPPGDKWFLDHAAPTFPTPADFVHKTNPKEPRELRMGGR